MDNQHDLVGLRGWLILVGIGVVLTPIRLAFTGIPTFLPLFSDGTWEALTTPGSDYYHSGWFWLLSGEMLFNIVALLLSLLLAYWFFTRDHRFPKLYIALISLMLISILVDAWAVSLIVPDEPMFDDETGKDLYRTLLAAVIWIPYMLISKRVKATFVEGKTARHDPSPTVQMI